MALCVRLKDIFDAIDFQPAESSTYLDKTTGEIVPLAADELQAAEDVDSLEGQPAWRQEAIRKAQNIVHNKENYIELPSQFDIDEYRIMERFCLSIADQRVSESLYRVIQGRGAFRRFKDQLYRLGIEKDWFKYREEALMSIAKEWCEDNNIEFTTD
jgi:hypothetical protein